LTGAIQESPSRDEHSSGNSYSQRRPIMARISSFRETGERYPGLRIIAAICAWLGLLLLALGVLLVGVGIVAVTTDLVKPINGVGGGIALLWSIGFFVSGLQSLVMGAFFRLAIHVEENTRVTAQALDKIRAGMEPKAGPEVDVRSIFLS
jgi:hypothetical protein